MLWVCFLSCLLGCTVLVGEDLNQPASTQTHEPEEGTVPDLTKPIDVVNTLQSALMAAYNNNPELVQLRHQFRATMEGVRQAQAEFLPVIAGEMGATYGENIKSGTTKNGTASSGVGSGGANYTQTTGSLTLQQNLFNGWASVAQLRSAEYEVQGAAYQMKTKEQEIFLNVIETFLEVIRLKADIEALKSSEKATLTNLEVAQNKMTIGEETRTQVALAEARLAEVQSRVQVSMASLNAAQEAFVSLTGRRLSQNLVDPQLPHEDLTELNKVLDSMETNLDVLLANVAYRQAQAQVDKAKGNAWYPTVNLTARSQNQGTRANTSYNSGSSVIQSNDRTTDNSVGVSVKYEFFGGGASTSKLNQAHAASAARRVAVESARYKVRSTAAKAWETYQAARLNVESFKRQVQASEISLEGMRQEMAAGIRILLDLLQRQSELLDAQRKLIDARKSVLLEGFRLMSLMGRLNVDRLELPVRAFNITARVQECSNPISDANNG